MSLIPITEIPLDILFDFQIKIIYFCSALCKGTQNLIMEQIDIKDISGAILLTTLINEGCKRKFTLMKEDYIMLSSP